MSGFGCDECGWNGDDPMKKGSAYLCPNCGTAVAREVDAVEADAWLKKKFDEWNELFGGEG